MVEGDPRLEVIRVDDREISACPLIPGDTLIFRRSEETLRIPRFNVICHYNVGLITDCLETGLIEQVPEADEQVPEAGEDLIEYRTVTHSLLVGLWYLGLDTQLLYNPVTQRVTCYRGTCDLEASALSDLISRGYISTPTPATHFRLKRAPTLESTERSTEGSNEDEARQYTHQSPLDIPKLLADPTVQDRLASYKADRDLLTAKLVPIQKGLTALDNETRLAFPGTLVDPAQALAVTPLRNAVLATLTAQVLELREQRAAITKQLERLDSEAEAFFTTKITGDDRPHEDSFLLDL